MNTSFGDLKEIFSTPPTEARYSWIIHSGHQTLEGSSVRRQPANTGVISEESANDFQSNIPAPVTLTPNLIQLSQRNDDEIPIVLDSANYHQPSAESASKRAKPNDTDNDLLQLIAGVETTINTQPNQSKQTPPTSLPTSPRYSQSRQEGARPSTRNRIESRGHTTDSHKRREDINSSFSECGSARVFGENYEQTKRFVRSQTQNPIRSQMQRNEHGDEGFGDHRYKNLRLQEEIYSANKKINRLNQINQNALKRKGELQKEVLDAYKKISELEVSRRSWSEQQRELTLELKTAKQRVGEAEREAAHAIGCSSKFQRELLEAENKQQKYFEDLSVAEKRITKIEDLMQELEVEFKEESKAKNELQHRLCESEASLRMATNENQNLQSRLDIKDKEMSIIGQKLEREILEREQLEAKSTALSEQNNSLKNDIKRLEAKHEGVQRSVDQYTTKLSAEKDKYELASTMKTNAERELREVRQEMIKERAMKELLNTECKVTIEKYRELKRSNEKTVKQNDALRRENRDLKDRVVYFELYQKINDKKSNKSNGHENSNKKRTCFIDTLNDLKSKESRQHMRVRSRNNSQDSWEQEVEPTWEQSQRIQTTWAEGYKKPISTSPDDQSDGNDLDKMSEMSARIEKLQKEQRLINHVTAESCAGSSKQPSRVTTARESMSPRSQKGSARSNVKTPRSNLMPNHNDTLPSFCDKSDDLGDDPIEIENIATFSDLLHDNDNKDIANALM